MYDLMFFVAADTRELGEATEEDGENAFAMFSNMDWNDQPPSAGEDVDDAAADVGGLKEGGGSVPESHVLSSEDEIVDIDQIILYGNPQKVRQLIEDGA